MTTLAAAPTPELSKAQQEDELLLQQVAGFMVSGKSFLKFLDWVYILARPQPRLGIPGGKQKFKKWPHLVALAQDLATYQKIVGLKARQEGFSWTMAAYAVWQLRFHLGANVLMFSQGQTEASQLLDKCIYIYRNLPEIWKLPLETESRTEIAMGDSRIFAYPSTSKAGQGETATLVILDEADRHEEMAESLISILPTVMDQGNQIVMGSTVNKKTYTSIFKETYKKGTKARPVEELPEQADEWHSFFWSWKVRPGRDQKWYDRMRANIPENEELPPDLYMQANYPNSEEEALAPAQAIATFKRDVLMAMREETRDPIRTEGPINIYREYHPSMRLCAGTDVGHGVGRDYSVTVIMERDSGHVVADICTNVIEEDIFGYESQNMMEIYGNPLWAIEQNDWGEVVLKDALHERYPKLYKRTTGRRKTGAKIPGWHTDGQNRTKLWSDLRRAVDRRWLVIPSRQGLAQFFDVVDNPDNNSIPEALHGAHDDYPMAVAIAWHIREEVYESADTELVLMPSSY